MASYDVEVVKERGLGETVDFVHRKGTFLIAKDQSDGTPGLKPIKDQVHISYEE